jgi:hypothetical protein
MARRAWGYFHQWHTRAWFYTRKWHTAHVGMHHGASAPPDGQNVRNCGASGSELNTIITHPQSPAITHNHLPEKTRTRGNKMVFWAIRTSGCTMVHPYVQQ